MSALVSPHWANLDDRRKAAFERAINVSGAGSVLVQNYVNRIVQQLTVREFGALGTMDRRPGQGKTAIVNRRTAGAMTTANVWVGDTVALTESTGSYAQTTWNYMTLATRGKLTRKMRAIGRSYIDILAEEMTSKLDDFNDALEDALFVGDSGAVSTQIDGLLTQITGFGTSQYIANTTAAAGDSLSLSKLDEAIDAVKGSASRSDLVIYGSFSGIRALNAALSSRQRFEDMQEIAAGFRVRTYDGIPLVVSTGVPDDSLGAATTGQILDITGEASSPTTSLAIVNKRYNWIEELTPTTMMPLARDDSQYEQFDLFWDGALVCGNTKGGSLLTLIKP